MSTIPHPLPFTEHSHTIKAANSACRRFAFGEAASSSSRCSTTFHRRSKLACSDVGSVNVAALPYETFMPHTQNKRPLKPSLLPSHSPPSAMPPLAAVATMFIVGTGMFALLLDGKTSPSLLPALPAAVPHWLFFWLLCEGIFYVWLKRLRQKLNVLTSPQR